MSDEDAFLKSICDAPDDDTPRLAFADWLQERGNPFDIVWASLIRVQVAASSAPPGEERDALKARERMLATPFFHGQWPKRMSLPARPNFWWGPWERGFPCELTGPFYAVSAVRGVVADRIPYRSLEIGIRTLTEFRRMLKWRELRRVTTLSVYSEWRHVEIGDAYAAELAGCASLAGLVALRLRFMTITDRGATDLLDSIHLRGVRELALTWTDSPGGTLSRGVRKRLRDRFGPHCLR